MPEHPHPTPKREAFAQAKAKGMKNIDAYRAAGFPVNNPATASSSAWKLTKDPRVAGRILELQELARNGSFREAAIDRAGVLQWIKDNYAAAFDKGNITAANKSAELMGKELGMFADTLRLESLDKELEGKNTDQLRLEMAQACSEIGMRVVDMDDEATRDFIIRNAARVGLVVTRAPENSEGVRPLETESL